MTYIGEGRLIVDGKPRPAAEVLKEHKDTTETAEFLCKILSGSEIMDESRTLRVQDSMNTRIIPHVHGTAKRMAAQTYDALMEELNAVFEDPVFLPDGTALMGSNWDATVIELYCDPLAIAVMDVAKLTKVHMERLVDPHLSGPPALRGGAEAAPHGLHDHDDRPAGYRSERPQGHVPRDTGAP